jgi:prophage regulatory protein
MIEQTDAEKFGIDPFVRLPFVMEAVGLSRSSIYKLISEGRFPKQIHLSERSTAWRLSELRAWMDKKQKGELPPAPRRSKYKQGTIK